MTQTVMSLKDQIKSFKEIKLDRTFYFIMVLVFFRIFLVKTEILPFYNMIILFFFLIYFFINIFEFKKIFFITLFCYFVNIGKWFTFSTFTGGAGSRVLVFDVVTIVLLIHSVVIIFMNKNKTSKINFPIFFTILMTIWIYNFLRGLIFYEFNYAFGEARFYFYTIIMVALIKYEFTMEDFRYIIKIIYVASFVWFAWVFTALFIEFDLFLDGEISRFNPGGFGVQFMNFSISILMLQYFYDKTNFSFFNKFLFFFFTLIIFLTGVRTIFIIYLLTFIFIYLVFNYNKMFLYIFFSFFGILLIYFIYALGISLTPGQTNVVLLDTMTSSNTLEWRFGVWEFMIKETINSWDKILLGRPFGKSTFDISSLGFYGWAELDSSLAHNDFISIFITNGILFVTAFILYIVLNIKNSFFLIQKLIEKNFSLILFCSFLINQVIQSSLNAQTRHYGISLLLWIFSGLLLNLYNSIFYDKKNIRTNMKKSVDESDMVKSFEEKNIINTQKK